jgi:hypothetical protein
MGGSCRSQILSYQVERCKYIKEESSGRGGVRRLSAPPFPTTRIMVYSTVPCTWRPVNAQYVFMGINYSSIKDYKTNFINGGQVRYMYQFLSSETTIENLIQIIKF